MQRQPIMSSRFSIKPIRRVTDYPECLPQDCGHFRECASLALLGAISNGCARFFDAIPCELSNDGYKIQRPGKCSSRLRWTIEVTIDQYAPMLAKLILAASVLTPHPGVAVFDASSNFTRPPPKTHSITVRIPPVAHGIVLPHIYGPADSNRPLVIIDAGHGGHDPGAINKSSGLREKDVTLAIARTIRDQLVASGRVRVALTREDDRFLVLQERYGIARSMNADLFISVHADSADADDATGATIYTLSETASDREAARLAARENRADIINGVNLDGQSSDVSSILIDLTQRESMALSANFAQLLQREAAPYVSFRTLYHRFASLVVLKAPDIPSVLFETGYISNARDAARLSSSAGQRQIAQGVTRAIEVHFARRLATQ